MKKLLFLFFYIISYSVFSQQDSYYTQYLYNMNVINPAYTGVNEGLNLRAFSRQQWVGVKGAPTTYAFTLQTPLDSTSFGVGVSLIKDKFGPVRKTNINADISYEVSISPKSRLSFGTKVGYSDIVKDLNSLLTNKPNKYDENSFNDKSFNVGLGLLFYTKNYHVGISLPYLVNKYLNRDNSNNIASLQRYYISGGYIHSFDNGIKLKPSFMYRGVEDILQSLDISLNILFNKGFEVGVSYKTNDAVSSMINYKMGKKNEFIVGYAYEYNFSELSGFSKGSHEIMLIYNLKLFTKKNFLKELPF